ncbi:hypothetical protein CDD83_2731 [Cordyceps sp. RAO-2017]|nr:hypothetical protein CDD83_2731 [Cordyceps sp. RAO-2017]
MGVPEEDRKDWLLGDPEAMGPPVPTPRWMKVKQSMGSCGWKKKVKITLGVLASSLILFAVLGGFDCSSSHKVYEIIDRDPVREPSMSDAGQLEWQPTDGCRNTPHVFPKYTAPVKFGRRRKLGLQQTFDRKAGARLPRVAGQIVLRPAAGDGAASKEAGTIELEVISNDERLRVQVDADLGGDNQRLRVTVPQAPAGGESAEGACVQMRATVWIPRHAFLRRLRLEAVHLDVELADGLVLGVADCAKISTVVGDVRSGSGADADADAGRPAPYTLQSPKLAVETVSGRIAGWFPLYSRLKLRTASGDVDARVAPKPHPGGRSKARLDVASLSGAVKVAEPLPAAAAAGRPGAALPARWYQTRLSSMSGDVEARLATNCDSRFKTVSGKLDLELLPVLDPAIDKKGSIRTETKSGDVSLKVLEPVWVAGSDGERRRHSLDRLRARHRSISGDLALAYPPSWEGAFTAKTLAGDIDVAGDGLDVVRRGGPIARFVEGRKGSGDSRIRMETVSGNVNLTVG